VSVGAQGAGFGHAKVGGYSVPLRQCGPDPPGPRYTVFRDIRWPSGHPTMSPTSTGQAGETFTGGAPVLHRNINVNPLETITQAQLVGPGPDVETIPDYLI
jgi:hypothetical protein